MRRRVLGTWQGGAWVETNEIRLVYDGMLPIQERDTNNNVLVTYTRGIYGKRQLYSQLNEQ